MFLNYKKNDCEKNMNLKNYQLLLVMNLSKLSICTITIVCHTSCHLKYDFVCDNLKLSKNIIGIEYQNDNEIMVKGNVKKYKPKKNLFYNQITLNINLCDEKYINCKVFTNGKIQMTGCRSLLDAMEASRIIVDDIDKINGYIKNGKELTIDNFEIKLINSIFSIGKYNEINRESLYKILISEYSYLTEYNPDDYPGIRIKFRHYINEDRYNWTTNDVCKWLGNLDCHPCVPIFHKHNIDGNKLLTLGITDLYELGINNEEIIDILINNIYSEKVCHIITIIVFRTGNIIITGAKSFEELEKPYKFITELLKEREKELVINNKNFYKKVKEENVEKLRQKNIKKKKEKERKNKKIK